MCMLSRGQPLWRVRKNKTNTLNCQSALWYTLEEWSETKGKEEIAVGRSLLFSLEIALACMHYNAEIKHVSTSGPGLLYIKDVSLWRGWEKPGKNLFGNAAPKPTKKACWPSKLYSRYHKVLQKSLWGNAAQSEYAEEARAALQMEWCQAFYSTGLIWLSKPLLTGADDI